jgi:[ribosomal protein S5]-alanine N-acetyltransferase
MQFETQRLILRTWQPTQDASHAVDIYGDAQVMDWIDARGKDSSIRQVQGRLQRYVDATGTTVKGSWAVEQRDIGRVIGHVILAELPDLENVRRGNRGVPPVANRASEAMLDDSNASLEIHYADGLPTDYVEIGWHFRPASWGFGYATEAACCIAQYAFDQLKLPLLLAVVEPQNRRSIALAERLGMCYDGFTTRYYGGRPLLLYRLSPEDVVVTSMSCFTNHCQLE